ncbi:MAG: primosomal protein N' [Gammaproteobacteria bacterium]|jgi:primosomal protein N' (replication factor Y)
MTARPLPIVEVAVPSPLYRSFDYRLPADTGGIRPRPGMRVLVPFGRRQVVGVILDAREHTRVASSRLKTVEGILDTEPVLSQELMELLTRAARYYQHPVGEVFTAALPVLLRRPGPGGGADRRVWTLTEAGKALTPKSLARAPRQARVVTQLAAHPEGLQRASLSVPLSVLRALQKKGWVSCGPPTAAPPMPGAGPMAPAPTLSDAQQQAVQAVTDGFGRFQAFLLEGVTGSGKTEVYLRLIEPLLRQGRQVLVLVPEIGLTPQLVNRFRKRLATGIGVLHSSLNDSQRLQTWEDAANGRAQLILGTRSAIFTPLARPGLILVDEEHDASLKQQDGFRYSARDLAVWRAARLNIPVLLGSATPSLETLYNVREGRYRRLRLPERAGRALAPRLRLLDLRGQPMCDLLSQGLMDTMERHLKSAGQVLVFLNRRGFSPVLLCHACGWVAECRRCDARMTLHQHHGRLRCHHCGSQRRIDRFCPTCGSSELVAIGEGTERVEQALRERFPAYPVLRVDRDTTRRKGDLEAALDQARSGRARILLGTQMLAKGHHFPAVTLVAVLDADQGLFSVDFRAGERMAQLIIQVAGRAGRADRPGEVLIQTHHPEHPLLRLLVEQGYPAFAEAALAERRDALLPPYASMALLRAEATRVEPPREFLQTAQVLAAPLTDGSVQIWGPVPAPMERRGGRYRAQLMFQARERSALQQLLRKLIPLVESGKKARRVRWSIDVDPVDLS